MVRLGDLVEQIWVGGGRGKGGGGGASENGREGWEGGRGRSGEGGGGGEERGGDGGGEVRQEEEQKGEAKVREPRDQSMQGLCRASHGNPRTI